jgi:hypothetical protein
VFAPVGEIVKVCPAQILPLLTAIVGLELTVTFKVRVKLVPQALLAVKLKMPLEPAVREMVFKEEVPDQPKGRLQT